MAPPPLLVSSFTQSILYGIYVATFVSCIRWLLYEDKGWIVRKKVNWPLLAVTLIVYACLTAYLSIFLRLTLNVMFGGASNKMLINMLSILANTAKIITDAVLMYRCWVVHARSWRVIFPPIVLWLSCLVALALLAEGCTKISSLAAGSIWPAVFTSCHIANNIYGTSVIVYEIMHVAKTSSCTSRRLKKTGYILIESGLVYTASGVLNLIFQVNNNLRNSPPYIGCIFDVFNFSMTGITFNFIIIRTGQERGNTRNEAADSEFVAGRLRELSALKCHVPETRAESTSQSP